MSRVYKCSTCRDSCVPGYGVDRRGRKRCYQCCALHEQAAMIHTGRAVLYMTGDAGERAIQDWTGTLRFACSVVNVSKHNLARVRYDVSFDGPDGFVWRAYRCGDNTQIAHCRRTRRPACSSDPLTDAALRALRERTAA